MSRKQKLLLKLLSRPKDFRWNELKTLLYSFDFELLEGSGSRVKFFKAKTHTIISLQKPHPGNVIHTYVINDVVCKLKESGDIDV